jgi:hypothetical protein
MTYPWQPNTIWEVSVCGGTFQVLNQSDPSAAFHGKMSEGNKGGEGNYSSN